MDNRLILTSKQIKVIERLRDILEKFKTEEIGLITEMSWGRVDALRFFNKEKVVGSYFLPIDEDMPRLGKFEESDKEYFLSDGNKFEKDISDVDSLTWHIPNIDEMYGFKMIAYGGESLYDTTVSVVLKKNEQTEKEKGKFLPSLKRDLKDANERLNHELDSINHFTKQDPSDPYIEALKQMASKYQERVDELENKIAQIYDSMGIADPDK